MTDVEIARSVVPRKIKRVARSLRINSKDLVLYGDYKAKVKNVKAKKKGKLILVTAINPTKAGIGKTTVSIGLADALKRLHKKVCLALREPSLGPVFGIKGGATGGGRSQVIPMEDINLHFNGDFHAITSANNLLCSLVDNHIFHGNLLEIDPETIMVRRCLDLNERALREVECITTYKRRDRFTITAASEVMAIMCMAETIDDLKARLGNIMVAFNTKGEPVYARDLKAENAMAILLKDALLPNLVQTLEGTPAFIHMGPFANIAHGCNSVKATKFALATSDYAVTEAGFGADLGAEKFIDFKCRESGLEPDCVVLVATIRALKLHGGVKEEDLKNQNLEALKEGLKNLVHHIEVIKNVYGVPVVVTLNKYSSDTEAEINLVKENLKPLQVTINDVWGQGGKGAIELAKVVVDTCELPHFPLNFSYELDDKIEDKIRAVVRKVYGGKNITLTKKANDALIRIKKLKLDNLPIIIAKTQFSLSADKNLLNVPEDFDVQISDIEIRTGAGFLVVIAGNMLLMPALSKTPAAENMTISNDGIIDGLF